MAKSYVATRHFMADGVMRKPGDVLADAGEWKNRDALLSQRYIQETDDGTQSSSPIAATPDPMIAQRREQERAAGREVGPSSDVAGDDKVLGRGGKGEEGGAGGAAEDDESVVTEEEGKALKGKLPDGFPGQAVLEREGLTTYAKVRSHLDTLEDIDGIAEKTGDKIRARFGVAAKFAEPEAGQGEGDSEANTDAGAEGGEAGAETESQPGDSTVPKAPNA